MSDLKYQSVEQLTDSRSECIKKISYHDNIANGQRIRLEWIDKYIYEKTPQELSIAQIESQLGHRVILK